MRYKIGIDVGGTFTDVFVMSEDTRRLAVHKTSSTPDDPSKAIITGLREIITREALAPAEMSYLAHGTTVATNAIIEQRGGKIGLLTTAGFGDLLEIGRQIRPRLYDLQLDYPPPLIPRNLRLEIAERLFYTGEVAVPLDEAQARSAVLKLKAQRVDAVVVCFLYAYLNPIHEARTKEIVLEEIPDCAVSVSHEVLPEFREYERLSTTTLNAFLMPIMESYLHNFQNDVIRLGIDVSPKINQCNGGVMSVETARRLPIRTVLSGPSAGVMGALFVGNAAGYKNLITFDMGGTSTDVCLLKEGTATLGNDRWVGGYPAKIPSMDVNAVGAGGGSIAWIDMGGLMKVGPQSAGANPGPACYGLGGNKTTVTDANLILGRLHPDYLLDGRMKVDKAGAKNTVASLGKKLDLALIDTALGVIRIVTANMVKAIRAVSVERGHAAKDFALIAFGGAGPLHAVGVAQELKINRVIVPSHPGILCAMGLLVANTRNDYVKTNLQQTDDIVPAILEETFKELEDQAHKWLNAEGFPPEFQRLTRTIDMRYIGQNFELTVPVPEKLNDEKNINAMIAAFHREHERNYGHCSSNEPTQIVNFRISAEGLTPEVNPERMSFGAKVQRKAEVDQRPIWFEPEAPLQTPVYRRSNLSTGELVKGPAVIQQMDSTTLIPPGNHAEIDHLNNIIIHVSGN